MKTFLTLFEVFVLNLEAAAIKVLINGVTGWQYAPPGPWGGVHFKKEKAYIQASGDVSVTYNMKQS